MAREYDHYLDLYMECHSLYEQKKYDECFNLGAHNLSDQSTPRYLQIKTLILLVKAVDDWYTAERFRIDAERRYQVTRGIMAKAESTSEEENKAMDELRGKLDELLEWQADDTPHHIATNFIGAQSPARTGRLKDFLYARYKREHPGEDPPTHSTGKEYMDEMEVEWEVEDDDLIPPGDGDAVEAAEAQVFGDDQNIIKLMENTLLADAEEARKEAKKEEETYKKSPTAVARTPVRIPRKTVKFTEPGRFVVE